MQKSLFLGAALAVVLSASAVAADMPIKAPPAPAPAPIWTGFYVGVDVGYGWKDRTVTATGNDPITAGLLAGGLITGNTALGPATIENRGAFGGIEGGYNWQINRSWLVGIEADFNASSIDGQGTSTSILTTASVPTSLQQITATQNLLWFGTVRPRIGWLANDNLLLYATGGFAYGRVNDTVNYGLIGPAIGVFQPGGFGFSCVTVNSLSCMGGTSTRTLAGWTAGAGAEYQVPGSRISFKAEYLYVNLGAGEAITGVSPALPGNATRLSSITFAYSQSDFHTMKFGLNWHF